ncbi:DUF2142 domain-containing protein [Acetobacter sp. KSO5]|uniref:DUF2142 domain-containing protein n=1 Tax=Acetobacter sp. KSO5 TaxID=3373674 RepID=UPI00376EBCC3
MTILRSFHRLSPKFLVIFSALFISFFCFLETGLVPPLQSPDERDHLKRAYWLAQGEFFLKTPPGQASGGFVDSGLESYIDYLSKYEGHPEKKIAQNDLMTASQFQWTSRKVFTVAPGTGYYFPVIYTPQAIGLLAGELMHLSIDRSYRLARLLAAVSAGLITIIAFAIYPPNALVLALLAIPMTLFQSGAASLDGMATAVLLLALSTFCQITRLREQAPPALLAVFTISVALVSTCRLHALPILLLPFIVWLYTRKKTVLWQAVACSAFSIGWTMLAMKMTVSSPSQGSFASGKLLGILLHPFHFAHLLFNTVTDPDKQSFYIYSFLGILGWLDTLFPARFYFTESLLLVATALLAISWKNQRDTWQISGILAGMGLTSFLLIFTALYLAWTPISASEIDGIQGRYFLIPALFLAYALGEMKITPRSLCAFSLFLVVFLFSVHAMIPVLLTRYYIGL